MAIMEAKQVFGRVQVDVFTCIRVWDWSEARFDANLGLLEAVEKQVVAGYRAGLLTDELEEDVMNAFGHVFKDIDISIFDGRRDAMSTDMEILLEPVNA